MIDFDAISRKTEEVRRKMYAIELAWDRATDTSVKISDMPRNEGDGKAMERNAVNIADLKVDYKKASQELEIMRKELEDEMPKLEKWQHSAVIRKRYLEGKRLEQIMDEIGYEWAQTNRYIAEAKAIINSEK